MEDAVGETPHLRVAALAGVGAEGVGQADYVPQGRQGGAEQGHGAGAAACDAGSQSEELARLAERADSVVSTGYLA